MKRSHIENGFKTPAQSGVDDLPLRPLTVAVNTTVARRCDSDSHPRGEEERALIIGEDRFQRKDRPEDSSTHTMEERKLEDCGIV